MQCLHRCLERHGRPVALYSDKRSIFRINQEDAESGELLTQFGRALKTLDIEAIHAHSPQAKGRIERLFLTLQDRLVKEMRLQGISSIQEANSFLPEYMQDHNRRFTVKPASRDDAHRKVLHDNEELALILSIHHKRKLSKNLTLQYRNTLYQVQTQGIGYAMRGATVTVCEHFDGSITLLYKGKALDYEAWQRGETPPTVTDSKQINQAVDQTIKQQKQRKAWKPAPDHPWRKPLTAALQKRKFLSGTTPEISTLG